MALSRWLLLVGIMVGVGCLQVAQRNAIVLKGYEIGQRIQQVHAHETQLEWLSTRVTGLASPTQLSKVAQDRRLALVAWATLSGATPQRLADAGASSLRAEAHVGGRPSAIVQAAIAPQETQQADDETSD